jgi:hypothetical protein
LKSFAGNPIPPRQSGSGPPIGATFPVTGRKSKPLLTNQPKLADVKFGIALSCAPAGMALVAKAIRIAPRNSIPVEP